MTDPTFSLIIPVFNEAACLDELMRRIDALVARIVAPVEVVLIDDGSSDGSFELIRSAMRARPYVRAMRLSRNFGQQAALSAGYDAARGQAVISLDADLQDPPEVVIEMIARWREGYQVVHGVRTRRHRERWFKKASSYAYSRVLRCLVRADIPLDAGDFRLMDRVAVDAFRRVRERNRFVRGLVAWIGFRQCRVEFERPGRYAGETKYDLGAMLRLAADGILSFSAVPLRLTLILGCVVSLLSFIAGIAALAIKLGGFFTVSGWTSIVVLMSFIGGVQLTVLGLIGEYISRIHDEVKARPLYIIAETVMPIPSLKPAIARRQSSANDPAATVDGVVLEPVA
ncbi:MAG TPA: glycosyltransferase family 2 protein [Planctomycetota bacterium]|nr:glycosyltransferase family 2 protein [Planctomycetota bacterium]